jgi:Zn-finger nucleic acid-binding protein
MAITYFIQICPICGRRLEVKIEYIGLEVSCYHCRGRFLAQDNESRSEMQIPSNTPYFPNQQNYYSHNREYSGEENIENTMSLF